MPVRPKRVCVHPGCGKLTEATRCPAHQAARDTAYRAAETAARRQRDKGRPHGAERGYDATWRRVRRLYLLAHPVCSCGARATDVDHVVPLREGGTHDWSNLQALCHACHSTKTAGRDGGFGNRKRRGDGVVGSSPTAACSAVDVPSRAHRRFSQGGSAR